MQQDKLSSLASLEGVWVRTMEKALSRERVVGGSGVALS